MNLTTIWLYTCFYTNKLWFDCFLKFILYRSCNIFIRNLNLVIHLIKPNRTGHSENNFSLVASLRWEPNFPCVRTFSDDVIFNLFVRFCLTYRDNEDSQSLSLTILNVYIFTSIWNNNFRFFINVIKKPDKYCYIMLLFVMGE